MYFYFFQTIPTTLVSYISFYKISNNSVKKLYNKNLVNESGSVAKLEI